MLWALVWCRSHLIFDHGQLRHDITATLEFVLDDRKKTLEDVRLARPKAANEQPASQHAMVLSQYASMADQHRELLVGLGSFTIGTIDLARGLAAALLDR